METRARLYRIADSEPGKIVMGDDDRLLPMPTRPTLVDFFKIRFDGTEHLLQSARLAKLAGQPEKVIMACLVHDIAVCGFLRADHGFWGEQMIAPYVDEEISKAVRYHQSLRFFPDDKAGYAYPEAYLTYFGEDYQPDPYIVREYQEALKSPYYDTARAITIYDIYAFDPDVTVDLEDFVDIIGRNFRQPIEGLGWDNTPASHIWRTIMRPNKFL